MRTVLWVMVGVDQLILLLIGAVNLSRYQLSDFALKEQLRDAGSAETRLRRQLHKHLSAVKQLRLVELVIAGAISVGLLAQLEGPFWGAVYALALMLLITALARLQLIKQIADRLFIASLDLIVPAAQKLRPLWLVTGLPKITTGAAPSSQAEFTDQLRRLPSTVLSPQQRQRLETVLMSEEKTVKEIMTPKRRVITVKPSATLGPVLLSDLEKSGHGYFPVATKKGEPEGVLTLGDVADIHLAKQHAAVRDLMSSQTSWVEEATSLYELAEAFLTEKQYLVLVRSGEGDFSGVVTIADLMKHLVGIVKD